MNKLINNSTHYFLKKKDVKKDKMQLNDLKMFKNHLKRKNNLIFNKLQISLIKKAITSYKDHLIVRIILSEISNRNRSSEVYNNAKSNLDDLENFINDNQVDDPTDKFIDYVQSKND